MTTLVILTSSGSLLLVFLVAWRLWPKPGARTTPVRNSGSWPRIALVGIVTIAAVLSPVVGLVSLVALPTGRWWAAVRRRTRTTRRVAHAFPDALDLLVLSIRAGYLPAHAIVEIIPFLPSPLRPAFSAVEDAMRTGERFADALRQLPGQLGAIAQPLVDSLSAADRYGLPLAPVLERLSFESRQQRRRDTDAAARELPVRLSMPLVLCTLPSFVLLAIIPLLLGALSSLHT